MSILHLYMGLRPWLLTLFFISLMACGSEMQTLQGEGPSVASQLGLTQYVGAIDPVEDS